MDAYAPQKVQAVRLMIPAGLTVAIVKHVGLHVFTVAL